MRQDATGYEGLRERKKRESREAMHLAALELVAQLGFERVTVEQIAERAGVSPRTLFNYWGTKEAVVVGIDPNRSSQLLDALRARPDDESASESMRALVLAHIDSVASRRSVRELKRQVLAREPQLAQIVFDRSNDVRRALIEVLTERLSSSLMPEAARDAAIVHVEWLFAILRSIHTLAAEHDTELDEALLILERILETHGFASER